jgi:hypothetical protein
MHFTEGILMMQVEMNDGKAKVLLSKNVPNGLIEPILNDLAKAGKQECEIECPKDKGKLEKSHYIEGSGLQRAVCNNAPYLQNVLRGHRVLTSERARRWWFAYLRSIGGAYHRKTSGPPGFVPPNAYHRRAYIKVSFRAPSIIKARVGRFYN